MIIPSGFWAVKGRDIVIVYVKDGLEPGDPGSGLGPYYTPIGV